MELNKYIRDINQLESIYYRGFVYHVAEIKELSPLYQVIVGVPTNTIARNSVDLDLDNLTDEQITAYLDYRKKKNLPFR